MVQVDLLIYYLLISCPAVAWLIINFVRQLVFGKFISWKEEKWGDH